MKPNDSFAWRSALARSARCRWGYFALFGIQTIGAAFLYWTALLLYRQVIADPSSHEAHPWTLVWTLSSIALMQTAYWVCYHADPPLPQFNNALIGHAILFLARMSFVLSTSVFGFVFVAQRPEFESPHLRVPRHSLGIVLPLLLRAGPRAPGASFHRQTR
jgi:hypothetical protein